MESPFEEMDEQIEYYRKKLEEEGALWKSVETDGLPKRVDEFIVAISSILPNGEIYLDTDVAVFEFDGGRIDGHWDTYVDWNEGQETHVTHWRELPRHPLERRVALLIEHF